MSKKKTVHQDDILGKTMLHVGGEYPHNEETYDEHYDDWGKDGHTMSTSQFRNLRSFVYKASVDVLSRLEIGNGDRKTIEKDKLKDLKEKWIEKSETFEQKTIIKEYFNSISSNY